MTGESRGEERRVKSDGFLLFALRSGQVVEVLLYSYNTCNNSVHVGSIIVYM